MITIINLICNCSLQNCFENPRGLNNIAEISNLDFLSDDDAKNTN